MSIIERLFQLRDEEYADFQAKLTPTVDKSLFIGVRVPVLRKFAKEIADSFVAKEFMEKLPHKYYEENILQGLIISEMKDYSQCIKYLDVFLPYMDNWAVCDITSPKIFKKNKPLVIKKILEWTSSRETYVCRFGVGMLMTLFLDEDFKQEYLEIPAEIVSEEYYVNMMIAWFFATALAKQWDSAIIYIEQNKLSKWVHNKTIQKACESYRISQEQKKYLRQLRLK